MQTGRGRMAAALMALVVLSACGQGEPNLMKLKPAGEGPDEFGAIPSKPLELPPSLAALPAPTPGGENRADLRPLDDAVIALGGTPTSGRGGVPASDGALLSFAFRYGVDPNIRQVLAQEDYAFRQANDGRLLERLSGKNLYYDAYSPYFLDAYAELERWRKVNVATPSAPPPPEFILE